MSEQVGAGQNKMRVMPVKKLLLNMGAPMMFSMLGQALYNVVDTFFVSRMQDTAAIADMGDKAINSLTDENGTDRPQIEHTYMTNLIR